MAKNDFKYIIQTDLKFSPGAINNLLKEAKTLDKAIKRQIENNTKKIDLPVGIDKGKALSNIQADVKKVVNGYNNGQAPKIKLGLELDRGSIESLKRQISLVKQQLNSIDKNQKTLNVNTSLNLSRGEKQKIQQEVGSIKATMNVGLRINKDDLKVVQAQVKAIRSEVNAVANKAISSTSTPNNTRTTNRTDNAHGQGMRRFGAHRDQSVVRTVSSAVARQGSGDRFDRFVRNRGRLSDSIGRLKEDLKLATEAKKIQARIDRMETNKAEGKKSASWKNSQGKTERVMAKDFDAKIAEYKNLISQAGSLEKLQKELAKKQNELKKLESNAFHGSKTVSSKLPEHHGVTKAYKAKIAEQNRINELQQQEIKKAKDNQKMMDKFHQQAVAYEQKNKKQQYKAMDSAHRQALGMNSRYDQKKDKQHAQALTMNQKFDQSKMNNLHRQANIENRLFNQKQVRARRDAEWNNAISRYGGNMQNKIKDDEKVLKNPDASQATKEEALKRLKSNAQELSRTMNTTLTRSFEIHNRNSDGTISRTRTLQFEFDRFGNTIDRSNRMMNIFRNTLMYTAVSGGFYAMVQGLQQAVMHMAEFESQLARVDMITKNLGTGNLKDTFAGYGQGVVGKHKVRRETYAIAQEMGVSNTQNVMPVYQQVMARTALSGRENSEGKYVSDPNLVRHITSQIMKYTSVSLGPNTSPQDVTRISEDMLSLYQAMFKEGSTQHIGDMDRFFDFMASMNNMGIDTNSISDAMGEIAPDIIKKGMDPRAVAALLGSYNLSDVDATGANMSTIAKTFFNGLAKAGTGSAPSVDEALKMLDIDPTKNPMSQQELLDLVLERYNSEKYENVRQKVDSSFSSVTGKGQQNTQKIGKLLEAGDSVYMDDLREELELTGQLETAWSSYKNTVKVQAGAIGQEIGELVELLAELGMLDGIKALLGGFKAVLQGTNALLDGITRLGDIFEGMGAFNIPKFVTQIVAIAGAIKLATMAISKFAGPQTISAFASMVGLSGITGGRQTTTSVPIPGAVGRRRVTTQSPATGRVASAGSVAGNIAGWVIAGKMADLLTPGRMFSRQNVAGARGANVASNLMTKFGNGLKSALPALLKFGGLLARLSIVGAAIGTVAFVGKKIYDIYKENKSAQMSNAYEKFQKDYKGISENPEVQKEFKKGLSEWRDLNKQSSLSNTQVTTSGVYAGGYDYTESINMSGKQTSEQKRLQELNKKYEGYNIRYTPKERFVPGIGSIREDEVSYQVKTGEIKDNKNVMREVKFNADDKNGWKAMEKALGAGMLNEELAIEQKWATNTEFVKDYNKELFKVGKITEEIDSSMKRLGMNISKIDFNFLGAENSPRAILAKINAIESNRLEMRNKSQELEGKRAIFSEGKQKGQSEYDRIYSMITSQGFKNKEELNDIRLQYQMASAQGDPSSVIEQYKLTDKQREKWQSKVDKKEMTKDEMNKKVDEATAIQTFIELVHALESFTSAEKDATTAIEDNSSAQLEQARMAKELRSAYLYASSGIEVYNAKINALNSATSKAQTLVALADEGSVEKIKAQGELLKASVNQVGAYRGQLAGVEQQMASLRATGQDFSTEALFNPQAELTSEQKTYKDLLNDQYAINDNINSSTIAIKEQRDALEDMILNSDKYADVWDRVQNRIQTVKDLNREIFSIQTDMNLVPQLAQVKSAITGTGFTESRNSMYENQRDRGLEVYSKAITALQNYQGDADKLKEAYDEINATMGSEFDNAFIAPLKELIENDFQKAGDLIYNGADKLDQVLSHWANTVTSGIIESTIANATQQFTSSISSSGGQAIPGFTNSGSASSMTDDEYIRAYIEQQFGYKKGSKEYAQTYKMMSSNMSRSEMVSEAKKTVIPEASNGQVNEYAKQIDKVLGGKLAGYGNAFVQAGAQHGIDPRLLASIAIHETGNGTSAAIRNKNNVGGIMGANGLKTFSSITESINNMADFLKRLYFDKGLNTIPQIGAKYAPVGASNDPTGLNNHWTSGVAKFYSQMTGTPTSSLLGGQAISSSGGSSSGGYGTLKKGSSGEAVRILQQALGISADGIFGNQTVNAVKAFQKKHGLTADGIVGSQTWGKLGISGSSSSGGGTALAGWGGSVTSNYGMRKHPISGQNKMHHGVDIAGKNGDPLDSNVSGKVVYAGEGKSGSGYGGYGNVVAVQDSAGQVHMYAHLSKVLVKVGDQIEKGTRVGAIGSTGNSTGPHLHYEIRKNGQVGNSIDPTSYINSAKTATKSSSDIPSASSKTEQPTPADIIKLAISGMTEAVKAQMQINSKDSLYENYMKDRSLALGSGNIRDILGTSGRTGAFDRAIQAREEVYTARLNTVEQMTQLGKTRARFVKDANSALKAGKTDEYNANKQAIASIDKLVLTLQKTNKELHDWDVALKKLIQKDPRYNSSEASKFIRGGYDKIRNMTTSSKTNLSSDYFRAIEEVNRMNSEYMTSRRKTASLSELWNNSGLQTREYARMKKISIEEDINLMFEKMTQITRVLGQFAQGTESWYAILEDAVAVQEELRALEQQRLDNAQRLFEMTGQGAQAYISQKAYVQSKDYNQADKNLEYSKKLLERGEEADTYRIRTGKSTKAWAEKMRDTLKNDYGINTSIYQSDKKNPNTYYVQSAYNLTKERADDVNARLKKSGVLKYTYTEKSEGGKMDYNQQLATMQVIAGLHDQMIQQMNDYRSAVVGAFKASALSLEEYMEHMHNLRDTQNEMKENAIEMVDSLSQGFEQSLSNAIANGMMGGMDSTQAFMDGIKQTFATTIASAISGAIINNSGLQNVVTTIIGAITNASVNGSPEEIANMFNENDFGTMINDAMAPFLPLIESIVASTDGIFAIMKDQLFNAPQGFKIDQHLYDMAKGKTFEGVKNWDSSGKNQAGSPIEGVGNNSGKIEVPDGKTPTGVPNGTSEPSTGKPSQTGKPANTGSGGTGAPNTGNAVKDPKKNTDKVNSPTPAKSSSGGHSHGVVKIGARGEAVKEIQRAVGVTPDGIFGPATERAVKAYQKKHKLSADGIVGSATWAKIHAGQSSAKTKTVKADLNFRSSPRIGDKNIYRVLPKGTKVGYISTSGQWAKVTHGGKTGYVDKGYIYHSGGIAGMMNFASPNGLKPDEIQAVLKKGEPVLTQNQVGSLVSGAISSPTGGGDININVTVNIEGNSGNVPDIEKAVESGVQRALSEYKRQQRNSNLSWKGTSY